jgi:NAD(P)H dehydrogenase (quinone)
MSVVIPATSGHLGRLIVTDLLGPGVPAGEVVAGARNLDAIADPAEAGVRPARIDYDEPATIEAAVRPGDTIVLISGAYSSDRGRQHADAVAAAERAGAGQVVCTSGLRAAENPSPIAAIHAPTEDAVRASGLPFTVLRNGWYTENYATTIPTARRCRRMSTSRCSRTPACPSSSPRWMSPWTPASPPGHSRTPTAT